MPWCPNCRVEYIERFNTCSDCNCELVDILEPIKKEEILYDKEAFLITVNDRIKADLVESILNANNIPVLKKHRESGAYLDLYIGMTSYGIDIYVPSKILDEAKELLKSRSEFAPEYDTYEDDMREYRKKFLRKRRIRTWIVLLFFVPEIGSIIVGVIVIMLIIIKYGHF